jgi:ATP-binding cassette, subfamily F, member 3
VFKSVSVLSGGEKSRLALVKLLLDPPNLLLMDEPTTHLDIPSIEALILALKQYQGTLLFVSHDVYFIRALASSVLSVRQGELQFYSGDYDYYLDKSGATSAREGLIYGAEVKESPSVPKKGNDRERKRMEAEERNRRSREKKQLENQLQTVEKQIMELEDRQRLLTDQLGQGGISAQQSNQVSQELKEVTLSLRQLTSQWETLAGHF